MPASRRYTVDRFTDRLGNRLAAPVRLLATDLLGNAQQEAASLGLEVVDQVTGFAWNRANGWYPQAIRPQSRPRLPRQPAAVMPAQAEPMLAQKYAAQRGQVE